MGVVVVEYRDHKGRVSVVLPTPIVNPLLITVGSASTGGASSPNSSDSASAHPHKVGESYVRTKLEKGLVTNNTNCPGPYSAGAVNPCVFTVFT